MGDITQIDRNFAVKSAIDKKDIVFLSADEKPFKIYGVFKEQGKYRRMPENVAKTVSDGVYLLHSNTAGGRVRFLTDSTYVAIHTVMDGLGRMPHFAYTGSMGFDLYAGNDYIQTFVPPKDMENGYESIIEFGSAELREITINFPLYSNVKELYVGIQKGATLQEPIPYKNEKPIVYYGSSTTQGGCASRPGMSYQAILSRRFHQDYINLGFAGSAKAEDEMVAYIKSLDMSMFVYDYDHNAPTVEHLAKTHEKMFCEIRSSHPNIPIIMMSRPKFQLNEEEKERLKIIEATYRNALASGDSNVYLINGEMLTQLCKNEGTVDNAHPTDFGFVSIAQALSGVIEKIVFV